MKKYLLLFLLFGCSFSDQNQTPIITTVSPEDFEEEKEVSAQLKEGFIMSLWAPGPLLSNAVALSFDNDGVAYIAETSRRKTSDIDIREHRDWMTEDIGLQTLEDTRAFHLAKLDPSLSNQNQWQPDFNGDSIHDWKDLMVQSEYIRRVWDSDGDGRADASAIFAEGFNDMITGIAAGIMHYDDHVYLTVAPDLWKLKDTDHDGDADERGSLSHGYGIHIAYAGHDMSGLVMGPDGRVYWSIGDIGVNVVDANGKRWAFPNQGAVMRINPDGTEFEVFAHGLRNPQEIAFDAYGNLISVDNDGDHPGEHERFVHILEGSDTGWRTHWQFGKYDQPNEEYKIWMDEKLSVPHFPGQAAYITPAIALAPDGPAGLAYNPGTALGSQYDNYFFASYFTGSAARSRVQAFKLTPSGASFALANTEDIVRGIVPTGVNFGPDGALYVNDWKDGYDLKPEGRIWKVDLRLSDMQDLRVQTQAILKEGMKKRTDKELREFLGHRDMRVRMDAQFELVKRNKQEVLIAEAKEGKNQFSRLHAIWGTGQLARKDNAILKALEPLLNDRNDWIRAQTAKVIGDATYSPARDQLIKQLEDEFGHSAYYAAEALGKIGDKAAFQPLVDLLEKIEESDPHLRHGIVLALARIGDKEAIHSLKDHSSPFVRIGAAVALRELKSPLVADFLQDKDPWVVTEAARSIHDDLSISEALPALAQALERVEIKEEAFVRRAINANLRLGKDENAQRLVAFATNPEAAQEMRADALWALGYWGNPPLLDRVEGRYRELPKGNLIAAQNALNDHLSGLTIDRNSLLKTSAVQAIGRLKIQKQELVVFGILKNTREPSEARIVALIGSGAIGKAHKWRKHYDYL
ncbi:MAG: HEAT repeat domain-containing protein [Bacteroidia bacterium]